MGTAARAQAYREWLQRVRAIDHRSTTLDLEMDLRVAEREIRLRLAEAEELRPWERNPVVHLRALRNALEPLAEWGSTGDEERLTRLADRQRQIPTFLAEARRTLDRPPALLTRQALDEAEGTLSWLRRDLPFRFAGAPEAPPKWNFERTNAASILALEEFITFLRDDLLPRSDGTLPVGSATVDRLVAAAGLAESGAELLEEVDREVTRLRRWVEAEAGRLSRNDSPDRVLARLDAALLPGDSALPVAARTLEEARIFIETRRLLHPPGGDLRLRPSLLTRPAPAVALDGPGPLGGAGVPRTLRIDPLGGGRPLTAEAVAVGALREGFPGRWLRVEASAEWVGRPPRLAVATPGDAEGWGLQAVALLLDQGFRGGDPLLRLAQLREHLRILARLQAGLRVHRGEWDLDRATREVARLTGLSEAAARREVLADIHDPLYGAGGIQALRWESLRNDLLQRPPQAGGPLTLDTALGVLLATGLPPDLARALLVPPPSEPQ